LRRDHPALPRVIEQTASIHHGTHITEWFERVDLAGFLNLDRAGIQVNGHYVAGFQDATQAVNTLTRIKFSSGHGVPEKNARKTLRQDHLAAGRTQGDRSMLARTAAAEVPAPDDNGIFAV